MIIKAFLITLEPDTLQGSDFTYKQAIMCQDSCGGDFPTLLRVLKQHRSERKLKEKAGECATPNTTRARIEVTFSDISREAAALRTT